MSSLRRLLLMVSVLIAVVVAAGCGGDETPGEDGAGTGSGTGDAAGSGPEADATQTDDGPDDTAPTAGDLIEATEREVTGQQAWDVRYLTTGVTGEPVEVTGVVYAPEDVAADADVVSWAHGTVGVADVCAPSANPNSTSPASGLLVDAGYVVAVTDYEGLGTPGTHPYLVGTSEARSVIDIVRAVGQLDLGVSDRYAVAGLSQGGHAALWAGQIAEDYAPELDLVGVVAAAPAADIGNLMQTVGTGAQGFAIMAAYAYDAAYDDVSLDEYFTPEAIDLMAVVETGCNAEVFATFLGADYDRMVVTAAWDGNTPIGPLADRLAENEVGGIDIAAPVLLVQGEVDAIVDRRKVESVHQRYCSMNTNAEYSLYLGGGHVDTIITATDDVLTWLADRFDGVDPGDGCSTVDPDLEAIRKAETTAPAVGGVLLEDATPAGYDTLVNETTAPRLETCPGTPIFGGRVPVAYSSSVWLVEPVVGPFLDAFVARFESAEEASAALHAFDRELIDCGEFIDPATTAQGKFSRSEDPGLGEESFGSTFSGGLGGIPVSRVGFTARLGDTVYSASQSKAFTEAEAAIALEAIAAILP